MRHSLKITSGRVLGTMAALGLLALAGCDATDPVKREYVWHPSNINQSNIAAMAANPSDLVRGRETQTRQAVIDTDAVNRVVTGKPTALIKDMAGSQNAGASSPGASGTSSGNGGT